MTNLYNLRAAARRIGPSALGQRVTSASATVLREAWAILHSAIDLRAELRRMADECENTAPEQAARLRKVASSNWDE